MTTGIEYLKPYKKRRGRGPSKKPTLVHVSVRLTREVLEYFETFPNKQAKIREVLTEYLTRQQQGANNGNI